MIFMRTYIFIQKQANMVLIIILCQCVYISWLSGDVRGRIYILLYYIFEKTDTDKIK